MIDTIVKNTKNYTQKHKKENRKKKGQFFTPLSIAEFMAMRASYATNHLSILEPGAGNGLLTASIIKYCMENELCFSFDVTFIENDSDVIELLTSTINVIKNYVVTNNGTITSHYQQRIILLLVWIIDMILLSAILRTKKLGKIRKNPFVCRSMYMDSLIYTDYLCVRQLSI